MFNALRRARAREKIRTVSRISREDEEITLMWIPGGGTYSMGMGDTYIHVHVDMCMYESIV